MLVQTTVLFADIVGFTGTYWHFPQPSLIMYIANSLSQQ
jgi:class 3 adenylate cyclase